MNQMHKNLFRELVLKDRIAQHCRECFTYNVPGPTAGGNFCWDSYCVNGWKLQENEFFGNWRVLDPLNIRRARGSFQKQLTSFLNHRPVSRTANYFDRGYAFSRYQGIKHETVILIHGWGVRASSMDRLAKMLQQTGYNVLSYDYPSSQKHIEQHAETFLSLYRRERLHGKIHFLTHSMGGLLLRYALSKMTETECHAIDSIVMLGPPNKGSLLALFGELELVKVFNLSLGDMVPGARALRIPKPVWLPPVGIIAGKFDGKVALADTGLPDGLPYRRVTVNCTHPELRFPCNTGRLIKHFFKYKTF